MANRDDLGSEGDIDVACRRLVRKIAGYKGIDYVNVEDVLREAREIVSAMGN